AMLAFMPLKEASAILKDQPLKRYAPDTIVDMNEIEKSLRKIRSQGYATISNELTAGKASIAAPIRDRNRIIVGAISISGSISQLDLAHREKELAQRVMLAADRISGKLGFFPK
ncbi:MAG: IclR family transcriptional regulator C-terminal domain-containing protein, partial [bacterium]|nr:IclR family transcriptional regulator C-terminal domain-containing protein [bacterium]